MTSPTIRTKQSGVAIIMAMLIVALATSVAAYAAWQQNLWIRQSESLTTQAQALAVSRAALYFGRLALLKDLQDSNPADVDDLKEPWAKFALTTPVEGGSVSGKIIDQQGLFNINNLAATNPLERALQLQWFTALLAPLDVPTGLAEAIQDFVDADDQGAKEDLAYLGKSEPYRTANRPIYGIDELYRVEGFDEKVMGKLKPFITAIPVVKPPAAGASISTNEITPINVNTAPREILDAVFGTTPASEIVKLRDKKSFMDFADFEAQTTSILPPPDPQKPNVHPWAKTNIAANSDYFLLVALSQFGNTKSGLLALVQRVNTPNAWPITIWQKQILD